MSRDDLRTLKGFRDFLPAEKRARDHVRGRIVEAFRRYGFEPVQTPTLELAQVILGKYGEEADRLVYSFEDRGGRRVALPYDQTVPTARLLAQHANTLPRFFRRYSIASVFRADKPQRGRYREFTQCDIDIYGSASSLADAEILACTHAAFRSVGFDKVELKINDRQTLIQTLEPFAVEGCDVYSIIQTIDKLDKMSREAVLGELEKKGLGAARAAEAMAAIESAQPSDNLAEIMSAASSLGVSEESLCYAPTLARGLDYYTGMIFEVHLGEACAGSAAGGGRYDNLIGGLGGPDTPAVGVGFGFDRIVEAAQASGLVPGVDRGVDVLVTQLDVSTLADALQVAGELRGQGVAVEVYPQADKLGKQFKLAAAKKIPLALMLGSDEVKAGEVTVKDLRSGEQHKVARGALTGTVQRLLADAPA